MRTAKLLRIGCLTEAIQLLESIPKLNSNGESLLAECRELLPYTQITYKGYKKVERNTGATESYDNTITLDIVLVKGVPQLIAFHTLYSSEPSAPIETGRDGYTYSAFPKGTYTGQYDFSLDELRYQVEGFYRYIYYYKKTN